MLPWREKDGWPAGNLPRAFSDMPRSCVGSCSSVDEEIEGVLELWAESEDCDGVGINSRSSSFSESSSSPMAKASPSSGTLLNAGVLMLWGLRGLSMKVFREACVGLLACSETSSFLRSFIRRISSWPLSNVNERRASNLVLYLRIALMKFGFPAALLLKTHIMQSFW